MNACPNIPSNNNFLSGTLSAIDCHAQNIGSGGYVYLTTHGSMMGLLINGSMIIFVALYGYKLILGQTPSLRNVLISFVKIGIVLTFATSWSAYKTLVYDVVTHGPNELVLSVGNSGNTNSRTHIENGLNAVDQSLVKYSYLGPGSFGDAQQVNSDIGFANNGNTIGAASGFWDPIREEGTIRSARTIYLISVIGSYGIIKLISGLFLALGPIFAIFLFFEGARGLFIGWIRILTGTIIGSFSTSIIYNVEVSLIYPKLQTLIEQRLAGQNTQSAPTELFVIVTMFGLSLLFAIIASAYVSAGINWPNSILKKMANVFNRYKENATNSVSSIEQINTKIMPQQMDRATSIANSINNYDRRLKTLAESSTTFNNNASNISSGAKKITPANSSYPIGRQGLRRTRSRVSLNAKIRDAL